MAIVYYQHLESDPDTKTFLAASDSDEAQPFRLEYLNEGNANVIYRIQSTVGGGQLPLALRNKLLRLRKDKLFIQPTRKQHEAYKDNFVPLFHANNLVEHSLVALDQNVFMSLNGLLQQLEEAGTRPKSRHGDTLAIDQYGLLMTDMTAQPGEIFLELKPKWLAQSPDAPADAVRCRTCALRARREAARLAAGGASDSVFFCPFGLISDSSVERQKAFEAVMIKQYHGSHQAGKLEYLSRAFSTYFLSSSSASQASVKHCRTTREMPLLISEVLTSVCLLLHFKPKLHQ